MARAPTRKPAAKRAATTVKAPPSRAERNIAWIEQHCVVPEGKLVGKPVVLRDWQRGVLVKIYDNPHITRRAIVSFGRKNGKTALSAMLLLLHLCGPEARPNSQLYSDAQVKEQAAVLYELAAKMVRFSTTLVNFVDAKDTLKHLVCRELGTVYKALSADAPSKMGFSPVFMVHDELGQVKGPRSPLYEALETGAGAHDDPLSIIISTQAATDADLLSILIDDAKTGADPQVVLSLYTADEDLDPFSDEAIMSANPAFGDFLSPKETRKTAEDARRMPAKEPSYRNLILNQRVEAHSPFVSRSVWEANGADPIEEWKGRRVYGGLDLSETSDLTAFVMVTRIGETWHVKPIFWLPADGLTEKAAHDRVPYDTWHKSGHLETTPGRAIEYAYVAHRLLKLFQTCDVQAIGFDRYNMNHLKPWLRSAGFTETQIESKFKDFGQGFVGMGPAVRELEAQLLNNRLAHGMHPVLSMCAANAVAITDPAGNRKLDKSKSNGRIDGMVALAMAIGTAITAEPVSTGSIFSRAELWT